MAASDNHVWKTIQWSHDKLKPATAKRWVARMDDALTGVVGYDTRKETCPRAPNGSTADEVRREVDQRASAWKARDRSVVSSLRAAIDDEYYDQFIGDFLMILEDARQAS